MVTLTDEQKAELKRLQSLSPAEQLQLAEERAIKEEQDGNPVVAAAIRKEIQRMQGGGNSPTAARMPAPIVGIPSARALRTGVTPGSRAPREPLFSRPSNAIPPTGGGAAGDAALRAQVVELQSQVAELRRISEGHGASFADVREGLNTVFNVVKEAHGMTAEVQSLVQALHAALTK